MIPRVRRRVPLRGPSRGAERLDPLRGQQHVSNFMSVHTAEHLDGFLGLLGVETDLLEEAPEAFAAHTAPLERPTTADARHEVNEEFGGARIGTPVDVRATYSPPASSPLPCKMKPRQPPWRCRFSAPAGARQVSFAPGIEHHERPEDLPVVARAPEVRGDEVPHGGGIEEPNAPDAARRQTVLERRPERPSQPRPDRDAEPLLAAGENGLGEGSAERALEDVLRFPASELQRRGDLAPELDQRAIQKTRADLPTTPHAC